MTLKPNIYWLWISSYLIKILKVMSCHFFFSFSFFFEYALTVLLWNYSMRLDSVSEVKIHQSDFDNLAFVPCITSHDLDKREKIKRKIIKKMIWCSQKGKLSKEYLAFPFFFNDNCLPIFILRYRYRSSQAGRSQKCNMLYDPIRTSNSHRHSNIQSSKHVKTLWCGVN